MKLVINVVLLLSLIGCGSGTNSEGATGSADQNNAPATWTQQAYLKAANSNANQSYGYSTAIDGDTIVVGALSEDSNQTTITNGTTASNDTSMNAAGAAYVYVRNGTSWTQQAYIKAANARASGYFGTSVAISGDTIAVGSYAESSGQTTITNGTGTSSDTSAPSAGAVYIYTRTGGAWAQQAYIKASNAGTGDRFGTNIALEGDTLVVGAGFEPSNQTTITNGTTASNDNSVPRSGAAYVFNRNGNMWAQEAYLKPPNTDTEDRFGYSVSISGNTIVATSIWESSNQTTITNGPTASADNSASHAGAAYVFVKVGGNWEQQAYLKAANAEANDAYGVSAAISGDTIVVGAYWESSNQTTISNGVLASNDNSATHAGAAYVYTRTGSNWSQQAYLKAANALANNWYGYRVAIDGDTLVIGSQQESSNQVTITNDATASSDTSASHAGAAYVYARTGTTWAQKAYVKASNARTNYLFSSSLAISQKTIVIGSSDEASAQNTITNGPTSSSDSSAAKAGAAYVYSYQ